MCKVSFIAKVTDKNRVDAWEFMRVLGDYMTPGNDDGFGYAAFDKSGNIFGEKWLFNRSAFTDLSLVKGLPPERLVKLYTHFGTVLKSEARAIMIHTRAGTMGGKNIENTHPFVDNMQTPSVAIIHNGMINNHENFKKVFSTCDSEVLAHLYNDHNISDDLNNLKKLTPKLYGWYTVINMSVSKKGRAIVDAYTDNGRLASYYIPELNTRVYSSDEEDIRATADLLGMTCKQLVKTKSDTAFRVDAMTGEIIYNIKLPDWVPPQTVRDNHHRVVNATGNFDDDSFKKNWFINYLTRSTNWRG